MAGTTATSHPVPAIPTDTHVEVDMVYLLREADGSCGS